MSVPKGIRVRYRKSMRNEREIDRDAWAREVNALLATIPRSNKAEFARRVGIDTKTVGRWVRKEVRVSEESVREVARVFGLPAGELLVRVGFYDADELASRPSAPDALSSDDEESIRLIMASDAPDAVKEALVREIRAQQRRDADERVGLAQRLLEIFRQTPSTT